MIDYDGMVKEAGWEKPDKDLPSGNRDVDEISRAVGAEVFVENAYKNWAFNEFGERICFSRLYPQPKVIIDILKEGEGKDVLSFKMRIANENGFIYVGVLFGNVLRTDDLQRQIREQKDIPAKHQESLPKPQPATEPSRVKSKGRK